MSKISRNIASLVLGAAALTGLAGCASSQTSATSDKPAVAAKPEPARDYVTVTKEVINDSWVTKYEGSMRGNKFVYQEKLPMEVGGKRYEGNSLCVWKADGTVATFEDHMHGSSLSSNEFDADMLEAVYFTEGKSDVTKRFDRPFGTDNFYTPRDANDKVKMDTLNNADSEYRGFRHALVDLAAKTANEEISSNKSRLQLLK